MFKPRHLILSALLALGASTVFAETITVTTSNATGPGSLEAAIIGANADASLTVIDFNIPGTGEQVINASSFPAITSPVTIAGNWATVLQGPNITGPGQGPTSGLIFNAGSAGSTVQGLIFRNYVFNAVVNTGNISFYYNQFQSNQAGYDVRLNNAGGLMMKSNSFTGAGSYAVVGSAPGAYIIGNTFSGKGLAIQNSGGLRIGDVISSGPNTFTNIVGDAINLTNCNGASVTANTINGASLVGIYVKGVDNLITMNKISGVTGFDIFVEGGWFNRITSNKVTGNNGIFNGFQFKDGLAYVVSNNEITGGGIELTNVSGSSQYGPLTISGNTITNNPQGASAFGSITVTGATSGEIINNTITDNASHGVLLSGSSSVRIENNTISNNGRVGVYVMNGNYNKISRNVIRDNHADAGGGRTGIFLNNANANKTAPVISSVKKVGQNIIITGTGTVSGDNVELFKSDRQSRNSNLTQNATDYITTVTASGSSWSATVPAHNFYGEVYIIATSTDVVNNTSMFSGAVSIEINGLTAATTNHGTYFYTDYIPGAQYQWWSTLPISSLTTNGNVATFWFNQPQSGTVSVQVYVPATGYWKIYNLNVTVMGPAKFGVFDTTPVAEVFPNPFASTTKVKIDAMGAESATLNLFNMNGEIVFSSEGHKEGEEVELGNNLENGIYTLQIIAGTEVKTVKIVKSK